MDKSISTITGTHINLRPLQFSDLPLTLTWRNDPSIRKWFVYSELISWEQHLNFYNKYVTRPDDFIYIIEFKDEAHTPVGQISLYNLNNEAKTAEFGRLMIGQISERGKGYAEEATALILKDAILNKGFSEIFLDVFISNQPAIHVYSKLGFLVTGQNNNMYHMVLKATDFKITDD